MKIACVIQGDIRNGFKFVLNEMLKHFDIVILSTWINCKDLVPEGNYEVIYNEAPTEAGFNHRNYQRLSTYKGILKAKELGADYVLKWRTDMLATNMNIDLLLSYANYDVPKGLTSRLVTCSFRNLTIENNDKHSSIPDLFAFGSIDTMELLWNDDDFNYGEKINYPPDFDEKDKSFKINFSKGNYIFAPESELYAFFRYRLQKKLGIKLNHSNIVLNYMRVFDHNTLQIVWFGNKEYRAIKHSFQYPWWTERNWKKREIIKLNDKFNDSTINNYFSKKIGKVFIRYEKLCQFIWFKIYLFKNN